jgi:myo-inositol-1(or 4)-monophosphatase
MKTQMQSHELKKALDVAVKAARLAGALMKKNLNLPKKINAKSQHDIKLDLDVRCQKLIQDTLAKVFPEIALLGEEGIEGDMESPRRWVVDPIDGTVNFTYGIPHACVSIALQSRTEKGDYDTVAGVVYDPFCDELWTAVRGGSAFLNGKPIHVSDKTRLGDAIVAMGFSKTAKSLEQALPYFNRLVKRARKTRIMGSAALALTYVASGRFDAYLERGINLWDIAAGGLIIECAGGEFWRESIKGLYKYRMVASNGRLRKSLESIAGF